MSCYKPHQVFQADFPNENGKFPVSFKYSRTFHRPLLIPCGQCIGCRLDYSATWAIRAVHESMLHEENCFITLTYQDKYLTYANDDPRFPTFVRSEFQTFMKKFRKALAPRKIRYYMCGEYGDQFGRPHFHSLIFGYDFKDKILHSNKNGNPLYESDFLSTLWSPDRRKSDDTFGFASVGSCTFESAAYVARYATKKVTGIKADEHYNFIDYDTGEIYTRAREFSQPSTRPGIAKLWFDTYGESKYHNDFLIAPSGAKIKIPRYYDNLYAKISPSEMELIKLERRESALQHCDNNSPERLRVREVVKQAQFKMLSRSLL